MRDKCPASDIWLHHLVTICPLLLPSFLSYAGVNEFTPPIALFPMWYSFFCPSYPLPAFNCLCEACSDISYQNRWHVFPLQQYAGSVLYLHRIPSFYSGNLKQHNSMPVLFNNPYLTIADTFLESHSLFCFFLWWQHNTSMSPITILSEHLTKSNEFTFAAAMRYGSIIPAWQTGD